MKTLILDVEANGLKPDKIWCVVTRDFDTGEEREYLRPDLDPVPFCEALRGAARVVGHNYLGYDHIVLQRLVPGYAVDHDTIVDTLVVSRLLDFDIGGGHSLEAWGQRKGVQKVGLDIHDWSTFDPIMVERCKSDCLINSLVYKDFLPYLNSPRWGPAIRTEHFIGSVCQELSQNGFGFNLDKCEELCYNIAVEQAEIDRELLTAFPPKVRLVREVTPRITKFGTLNRNDFRWAGPDLSEFNGGPFSLIEYQDFNPGSPPQIVERLNEAGWKPVEKTKGHIQAERDKNEEALKRFRITGWKVSEINLRTLFKVEDCLIKVPKQDEDTSRRIISETLKRDGKKQEQDTISIQSILVTNNSKEITELLYRTITPYFPSKTDAVKFADSESHLWSITATLGGTFVDFSARCATVFSGGLKDTETQLLNTYKHLQTHFYSAPPAAQKLARRIILASRLSDLEEWKSAYNPDTLCVHGSFAGVGSWTGRMAHFSPNTANIPREDAEFGGAMRALWQALDGEYLVGVDAEGIQLRVLAHYINDERFTFSVVSGKKEDGTDPHSLNWKALGSPCKSRNDAKTFIYAWLLGAGIGKVGEILGCSFGEAKQANSNFIDFYPGLKIVKSKIVPRDAERGYFEGFDGRYVKIRGDDEGSRRHFALAGYLQNGETVVMKRAMEIWKPRLEKERIPFLVCNFVHDEWQTRVKADYDTAVYVAKVQADAIRQAGEDLKLRCPMAGSIMGGHGKIAVAKNWLETH